MKKEHRLTWYIFGSIVFAVIVALLFPDFAIHLAPGGEIFLRLLKMMVVPLVVTSVMSGVMGLGDVRKLGRPGGWAILYYLSTTILAVAIGLIVVNIIRPGVGTVSPMQISELETSAAAPEATPAPAEKAKGIGTILENLLLMLFTDNLIESAANTNLLPLIFFSLVFAAMLTTMGSKVASLRQMIVQVNDAMMGFVLLLMKLAPLGIFCLVAARFGKAQADGSLYETMRQTFWYFTSVIVGLGIHAFVFLPLIYWTFTRKNPYRFMVHLSQALLTAFSTASSSATLPVSMQCAQYKAGISKRSTEFVLPLGATINMDGTALYEASAAIFIAQVVGMDLTLLQQLVIAVTATLAAIGAAGIPEAGLVTMVIVLNSVGLPVEYIGLILSVDWLLDRFRTTVNAFGDCAGAAVVERSMVAEPESA